jgi:hypothetical protein
MDLYLGIKDKNDLQIPVTTFRSEKVLLLTYISVTDITLKHTIKP